MTETHEPTVVIEQEAARADTGESVWLADLVARIQAGDTAALSELYAVLKNGMRFLILRRLGPDFVDDQLHEAFLIVATAIQQGRLRDPERLMGFIRTVVTRQSGYHVRKLVRTNGQVVQIDEHDISDSSMGPEALLHLGERRQLMREVLEQLPTADREILMRFYVLEQAPEQICREMSLTETQFRLRKSRAKCRVSELAQRRLARRRLLPAAALG